MADGRNLLKKLETIDIHYTESGEWKSNIDKEVENMRRRLKSALEKIEELQGE
tara:strand:- start:3162 stop:3320 length:159 start_codon:yes stop_codon:yes gene_type:complete